MGPSSDELIDSRIRLISSLPVIRGYYLVLGGGKVGCDFLKYAKKARLPFVLVIDNDAAAPASLSAGVMEDRGQVISCVGSLAASQENEGTKARIDEPRICFHRMDMHEVFSLLMHGIPEYIIPAVPLHAVADIVEHALDFGQDGLVHKLSIDKDDETMTTFFRRLVSAFPEDIIAGAYPEHGAIFLSYAQPGEICPDNCPGQENYCRTFSRAKPRTITSYAREASRRYPGQVFDSYQMRPGIGGIKGTHLKENLISAMEHVRSLKQDSQEYQGLKERSFFVATTCNCHGILTLLYSI